MFRGNDLVGLSRSASCTRHAGTCRWCTRTRSARSTRAGGSRSSWRSRCVGHTGSARGTAAGAGARSCSTSWGWTPTSTGAAGRIELSGGQAQRVAIARAIALNPALIICDEAVSSLDVLIQAQVLNLFEQLRVELGLSYLFIAHDLALVKQVSDQVAVMHLGQLAEIGPAEAIYRAPRHPYTVALLDSIPGLDPVTGIARKPRDAQGRAAVTTDPPSGCRFRTRCPRAQDLCAEVMPPLTEHDPGHFAACHFPLEAPAVISSESLVASIRRTGPAAEPINRR